MRFDLSDDEWALLEPLMPKSRKSARADDRKIMNAIFYVLRTGMPWCDLPHQRLAPHRHTLRKTRPQLPCRHGTRRGTLLDRVVSPDPGLWLLLSREELWGGVAD